MIIPTSTAVTAAIMNNPIVEIEASELQAGDNSEVGDPSAVRRFHAIPISTNDTFNSLKNAAEFGSNDWSDETFSKIRPVGATIRCFKTSTSENESGIMVGQYGPVGLPFDNGHTIESELHREGENKKKLYVAG